MLSSPRKAAREEVASLRILAVHPPGEVDQQLLERTLEKERVVFAARGGNLVDAPARPRMDGRIHVAERELVRRELPERVSRTAQVSLRRRARTSPCGTREIPRRVPPVLRLAARAVRSGPSQKLDRLRSPAARCARGPQRTVPEARSTSLACGSLRARSAADRPRSSIDFARLRLAARAVRSGPSQKLDRLRSPAARCARGPQRTALAQTCKTPGADLSIPTRLRRPRSRGRWRWDCVPRLHRDCIAIRCDD